MSTRLHASSLFRTVVPKLSKWFFKDKAVFRECIKEDITIRNTIERYLPETSYIQLIILRTPQRKITVKILTQKPDLIIKDENKLQKIKNKIKQAIGQEIVVNIEDPEISECFARQYAIQLKQSILEKANMRIIIRKLFSELRRTFVQGMKIVLSGRLTGSTMARKKIYSYGNVPKNDFSTYVDEYTTTANTTSGSCGVRVTLAMKKQKGMVIRKPRQKRFFKSDKQDYKNYNHKPKTENESENKNTERSNQ